MYRTLILAIALASCFVPAVADNHLAIDFANGVPDGVTLENVDGKQLKTAVYNVRNLDDTDCGWFVGRLKSPYNRCALSPTHLLEGGASDNRMTLPALHVETAEAVVIWEARSLHKKIAESYRVVARKTGDSDWTDLYVCDAENHGWTRHVVSLADFVGEDVEICFIATTADGFMLAVDNIEAGVPVSPVFGVSDRSRHFVAVDDDNTITGTLTNYGRTTGAIALTLSGIGEPQTIELPSLASGQSADFTFDIAPEVENLYDYTLTVTDGADGLTYTVATGLLSCQYAVRTHFLDRCSGTWCAYCPSMELNVTAMQQAFGDQLVVAEVHINDLMQNNAYSAYTSNYVFAIPRIDLNHSPYGSGGITVNNGNTVYRSALSRKTFATISATYEEPSSGYVDIKSTVDFALDSDNSDGLYRIGYMILGSYHDPDNRSYRQENSATYQNEQYFYLSEKIPAEMMWYDDVVLEASTAVNGIDRSLPAEVLLPGEEYTHEYTLKLPKGYSNEYKVVAMLFDNSDGSLLNCSLATEAGESGVGDIVADSDSDATAVWYDLMGRRVENPANGLYIKVQGHSAKKQIIK